jgi:hypothetical protein
MEIETSLTTHWEPYFFETDLISNIPKIKSPLIYLNVADQRAQYKLRDETSFISGRFGSLGRRAEVPLEQRPERLRF